MKNLGFVLLFVFASLAMSASAYSQTIPPQNHLIALADAKRYIQNYRNNPTPPPTAKGGYFWREIFDKYWHNLAAQEFGITMRKWMMEPSQL
jgi:hypothetical protein